MLTLLITLTVLEIVLFLGAVVVYLIRIHRSLRGISLHLGKVTFGVRAIETQTDPIGTSVTHINRQLEGIAAALDGVAALAGKQRTR